MEQFCSSLSVFKVVEQPENFKGCIQIWKVCVLLNIKDLYSNIRSFIHSSENQETGSWFWFWSFSEFVDSFSYLWEYYCAIQLENRNLCNTKALTSLRFASNWYQSRVHERDKEHSETGKSRIAYNLFWSVPEGGIWLLQENQTCNSTQIVLNNSGSDSFF